ncbi:hypothetical protein [Spiroplasma sp. SV19]|uniref:hypothetical protein n=1 Tax=Spiroplasma sp. SV19 TaxID=2570468 RepID=UPI0024B7E341|nr:hypothetical protein [Spiroplasma sp. SV19]WHQ37522.1 hypothetical protein E7Y35_06735 [Spiroplasma sp. SV19]
MNNLLDNFTKKDITHKETNSLCVDIRKSTKFHSNFSTKTEPAKIVASFISKCYLICNNKKLFSNYIYAGDGIIAIAYGNDNAKAFEKTLEVAIAISKVIENFKDSCKKVFDAGIGIAFDNTTKVKVKNLPIQYNNELYTGDSVAISSKICGSMPLRNNKYKTSIYIGMSKRFANNLLEKFSNHCKKTSKKYIYLGDSNAR